MFLSKLSAQEQKILAEAADWLLLLQESHLDPEQQQCFEQWKQQSPQHQRIWQKAEKLQAKFNAPAYSLSKSALSRAQQRPEFLSKMAIVLLLFFGVGSSAYWAKQQAWLASYRTDYGEQRELRLADGTEIQLNSKTALDIQFDQAQRMIVLHYGEIYVKTGHDSSEPYRPFYVQGRHGQIQALGTEFDVKQQSDLTAVAVIEHAVKIDRHAEQSYLLKAGQQIDYDADGFRSMQKLDQAGLLWKDGLIVADKIPLSAFSKQIEQYYNVKLYLTGDCGNMLISGAYPIHHLDHLLAALEQAYGLKINKRIFNKLLVVSRV